MKVRSNFHMPNLDFCSRNQRELIPYQLKEECPISHLLFKLNCGIGRGGGPVLDHSRNVIQLYCNILTLLLIASQ